MKSRTDLVHSYVNIAVNITIYHCGGFYHHGSVLFIILLEYINFVILFLLFLGSSCGLTKQDSKVSCDLLTPAFRVLAFGIINWSGCVENGLWAVLCIGITRCPLKPQRIMFTTLWLGYWFKLFSERHIVMSRSHCACLLCICDNSLSDCCYKHCNTAISVKHLANPTINLHYFPFFLQKCPRSLTFNVIKWKQQWRHRFW